MNYLPLFVDLKDRPCLIVGAGEVAARKAALLLRAGARLRVIAPAAGAGIQRLHDLGELVFEAAAFTPSQLAGQRLVIAATDNPNLNREVFAAARDADVLCNAVDDREHCDFILPAIVDRDPVLVAFSTGGEAPVLAQRLKSQLEAWLPARIGTLARRAGQWRGLVKKRFSTIDARRRFWQRFFGGPIAADLLAGRDGKAERAMRQELISGKPEPVSGSASIVGAGPGDPALMTLRAQQLLSNADVVLYDRLVSPLILDMARKEAVLISVGKEGGGPSVPQAVITDWLLQHVRDGKRVCRLKGGDPFVFGRGGEEAAALAAADLPFEIVPGISAALGCAAYSGIPLTLRGVSASVTFATASLQTDDDPDWAVLARPGQTLALYMSLQRLQHCSAALLRHGLPASTPAALVAEGTTPRQRIVRGTVATIAALATGVPSPAILFVGEAVALSDKLSWFGENGGQTVVTGRSAVEVRRTALSA